jgi:hypothetical protein
MATIERVIDGHSWKVGDNGNVYRDLTTVLRENGEQYAIAWQSNILRTAFALRDEWDELDREERLNAPPTVELPRGYDLHRSVDRWLLLSPSGKPYWLDGNDLVAARYIIAAADELAARKNHA